MNIRRCRRFGVSVLALRPVLLTVLSALLAAPVDAAIRVVASTNDLASIAAEVGGDRVEVSAIARAQGDPHRVEVLPSYMVRTARAQLYLKVGLGLDQWADAIIDGSHNGRLVVVDCSRGVSVMEKPTTRVDASLGDVHPDGNPHYWLDPANGAIVATTIAEALARLDPEGAAGFAARAEAFGAACRALSVRCAEAGRAVPGQVLLTYHRSWSYMARAFGLDVAATVEPFPGIPPTARHLQELVALIRARSIPLLLMEPYFSGDSAKFLGRETPIRIVTSSASCTAPTAGSYLAHFEELIDHFTGAGGAARP
jgi:zinc/manganese transport system substrate-binding protein